MCLKRKLDLRKVKLGAIPELKTSNILPLASLIPAKLPKFPPAFNVAQDMEFELVPYLRQYGLFGNEQYGDCVVVASTHYTIHAEYAEQRKILREIIKQHVVDQYFKESGGQDVGLIPTTHFETWRTTGLNLGGQIYRIDGYADISIPNIEQLKASCNWLYGAMICAGLPLNAQKQKNGKRRRYEWVLADGPGSELGSWGYHEMYCPGYVDTPGGQWILLWTWGSLIYASFDWYKKYCVQATAILDQKDGWVDQSKVNFKALKDYYDQLKKGW